MERCVHAMPKLISANMTKMHRTLAAELQLNGTNLNLGSVPPIQKTPYSLCTKSCARFWTYETNLGIHSHTKKFLKYFAIDLQLFWYQ